MVWLTGGMFAVACLMIASLLGLILYQGLATHWQRPYVLYPLNSGEVVGGELIGRQEYSLNRQAVAKLDDASQAKAMSSIDGDGEHEESMQLYLRSGNYDLTQQHFVFVPEIRLSNTQAYHPESLWLLERREWGVFYGFPVRYEQTFAPEYDAEYRLRQSLLSQLDSLISADLAAKLRPELEAELVKNRESLFGQWQVATAEGSDATHRVRSVVDSRQLPLAVAEAMTQSSKRNAEIERAKHAISRGDQRLESARLGIRKAELAEEKNLRELKDLQELSESAAQLASSKATIEWTAREQERAIESWLRATKEGPAELHQQLTELQGKGTRHGEEELTTIQEAFQELNQAIDKLPAICKSALDNLIKTTHQATLDQLSLNAQLASLEEQAGSETLTLQAPVVDWVGEVASNTVPTKPHFNDLSSEIKTALGIDEGQAIQGSRVAMSDTQAMLTLERKQGPLMVWTSQKPNEKTQIGIFREKSVLISDIVRVVEPNRLSFMGRLWLYAARWFEFLFGQPREAGVEGGFFPAIWGTVVMTLIMSIAVMPFGVMAALYMREYAKSGWVLSLIRISINNLAGVPSIVYGVFGLAFFCYTIGGYVDGGPAKAGFEPWPSQTWFIALGITALCGTAAFMMAALGSGSPAQMSALRKRIASLSGLVWFLCLIGIVVLLAKSPFFNGFYQASLPNPTFGKGCLLWASCTLALLTLPVVIVATEEAIAAVPNSLREGSYACGAGKWQTLQRIVLPYARPGIITGFILAMARGAGEVAPMMLVGAIPLATDLPLDLDYPFFHGSRSFMHLGFQIYSLGFQSQNSEAAKPMVFTATLLLLTIVTLLNLTAIWLRARLRKRFQGSQF